MTKSFKDLLVVELTTYVAASTAGRLFAANGAKVIKVEPIKGDPWRYYGPMMTLPNDERENPVFDIVNANKEGISLNIKEPEGRAILDKLLEKADVFITNNRPKSLIKDKLDYDTLKEKYPSLVYANVTGYGDAGPDVDAPGFDTIAYWARTGLMHDLCLPNEHPITSPPAMGDISIGGELYAGIMTALFNRVTTGKGDRVTVSIFGCGVWHAGMMATTTQKNYGYPYPKERWQANPVATAYCCKDGEWIMPSLLEYNRYMPAFCECLELDDLTKDERFCDMGTMRKHGKDMTNILDAAFAKIDSKELSRRMGQHDIAHTILGHFSGITEDPQALLNGNIIEYPVGDGSHTTKTAVPPQQFSEMDTPDFVRGPLLGENSTDVLEYLGYTVSEIDDLTNSGVVNQHA